VQGAGETTEANDSPPWTIATQRWSDVVAQVQDPIAPLSQVNITIVAEVVDKVQDLAAAWITATFSAT
jgi:hypothetical protein